MRFHLGFLPDANRDFHDAIVWYGGQRGFARKFVSAVRQVLKPLRTMPRIHGFAVADVRRAPVKGFPYVILYRIISSDILVVAVIHTKREPNDGQKRE